MSIPAAWPQVLDFFGTPLAIEPSPGQLCSDAGLLPVRKFDRRIPTYARLEDPTPDGLLRRIQTPTLVMLGGKSELHDVTAVADKAQRLIENLELHVVDGASHALPITKPNAVANVMLPFLEQRASDLVPEADNSK